MRNEIGVEIEYHNIPIKFFWLQVCWGSYDTLTGHGLNVQKIKKGMLHYLDLEKGLCSKNSKIL